MGIVAEARGGGGWGVGWRLRVEVGLFARAAGARELCAAIASICRAGAGGIAGGRD